MKHYPPKYVKLGQSELILRNGSYEPDQYWRDAGQWGVEFRFDEVNQKWYSVCNHADVHWLDNVELVPITKTEWKEGNKGYI